MIDGMHAPSARGLRGPRARVAHRPRSQYSTGDGLRRSRVEERWAFTAMLAMGRAVGSEFGSRHTQYEDVAEDDRRFDYPLAPREDLGDEASYLGLRAGRGGLLLTGSACSGTSACAPRARSGSRLRPTRTRHLPGDEVRLTITAPVRWSGSFVPHRPTTHRHRLVRGERGGDPRPALLPARTAIKAFVIAMRGDRVPERGATWSCPTGTLVLRLDSTNPPGDTIRHGRGHRGRARRLRATASTMVPGSVEDFGRTCESISSLIGSGDPVLPGRRTRAERVKLFEHAFRQRDEAPSSARATTQLRNVAEDLVDGAHRSAGAAPAT